MSTAEHTPFRSWSGGVQLLVVLLVVAASTVCGWRRGRVFAPFDLALSTNPNDPRARDARECVAWTQFAVDRLRQGEVPLWDTHLQMGMPFIGIGRSAVFFPTTFFHLVLPATWSWLLAVLARLLTAAAGAWLLARRFGLSAAGRAMAAISFALSGLWLQRPHDALVNVGVVAPWVVLSLDRLMNRLTPTRWALAAVAIALACLGGDPAAIFSLLLLAVALVLTASLARGPRLAIPRLLACAAALAVGVALAGIQLFPLGEYLENLPVISAAAPLPWWRTPLVFDLIHVPGYAPGIFGAVALVAVVWAIAFHWRGGPGRCWLIVVVVWAVLTTIFLALLLSRWPVLANVLATRGLLVGALLPLTVLAGIGLECIAECADDIESARRLLATLEILAGVACTLGIVLFILGLTLGGSHATMISVAIRCLIFAAVLAVARLSIAPRHAMPVLGRFSPASLLLALATVELLIPAICFLPTSGSRLPKLPTGLILTSAQPSRVFGPADVLPPASADLFGFDDVRGQPALPFSWPEAWLGSGEPSPSLARLFNIHFWLGGAAAAPRELPADGRAWMVPVAQFLPKREEVLQRMGQSTDIDPSKTVLIDPQADNPFDVPLGVIRDQPDRRWFDQSSGGRPLPSVHYRQKSPEEIDVSIDGAGQGWLVVADRLYPGWQAQVWGQPVRIRRNYPAMRQMPIIPAFGSIRALFVPPRTQRVTFTYEPLVWRWGCFASAGGVMAVLLALGSALFGRRGPGGIDPQQGMVNYDRMDLV